MSDCAIKTFERWESTVTDPELQQELQDLRAHNNLTGIEDAFFTNLAFGTAGLRGVLGAGSNRMNIYTVAQATQGLATYLLQHDEHPSVAIAHDSRHKGVLFAQTAAGVLAANGVRALLYPRLEPTPALSFAVRDLHCSAGINITASHNPAEYNGYKVYGPDGCQITTQAAHDIQQAILATDIFEDVRQMPFEEALASGLAAYIAEDTLDRFIDAVALQAHPQADDASSDLQVVYTPLNGTGLECVQRILDRVGIHQVTVVPEQAEPDGDFPTCPYPNPEIREALTKGLELCEELQPDLLIATDPDADRVGVAVREAGAYQLVTGNEMGVLLTDWLASHAARCTEDISRKVCVSTIVSSSMTGQLAQARGFELRKTLTGFKYIGEQIGQLEAAGEADRFLFGFEESYGYLAGTHVRDKDAIVAVMLICQMAQDYKSRGMTLIQAMEQLYREFGYSLNRTISLSYPGAQGTATMRSLMEQLRTQMPRVIGDFDVERIVDYKDGAPMPVINPAADSAVQTLPPADVIEFGLQGGSTVIIRPSGTEPKIKAYLFAQGSTREEAASVLDILDAGARSMLQA